MQVRNEIAVLKRVSAGHPNIVSLHDFFETTHNLYVSGAVCRQSQAHILSLSSISAREESCLTESALEGATTRSAPPDRYRVLVTDICRDAQNIVRTVTHAVKYLHDQGIVHRGKLEEGRLMLPS